MDEWYLMRSKPRQEERAVKHLKNQGFEPYCPMMKKKSKNQTEPLFPGYIFLLAEVRGFETLPWDRVRSTRGVMGYVKFGGGPPVRVSDELVEGLRDREKCVGEKPVFQAGQRVIFQDGPFADLEGIYLCSKGDERCVILLNILNRDQPVSVEQAVLKR